MVTRTETDVDQLQRVVSSEGADARPATDERLERIREQSANGPLRQMVVTAGNAPVDSQPVPNGALVDVQAHHENDGIVYVGDADSQERALAPREFTTFGVSNLDQIHARGSASDRLVLTWAATEATA
jgi:hypothetical protein